ncbi:MAG: LuxR C-terminal-related transcriptional regulator, partial [Gaiellaceae bacterium]
GKTADAKHLIASLERRGREQPVLRRRLWAGRGAALRLAGEGDVADALAVLEALLTEHHLEAAPVARARTLLLKGKLERRVRHKAAARTTLARAGALFDELGAAAWSAKVNAEMSRLGLRRARDELSDTEQRVAALAAAGKTNREIAADLFISRRTVEANVARVYRKLGVNSRAALAGLLTRRGEASEHADDRGSTSPRAPAG